MIEICFVCTGNTCRSPMAERIARKIAKAKKMKDIKFSSAGIFAKGDNISEKAVLTLKKMGYDSRSRKSVLLKKTKPNVIYVALTDDHKKYIPAKRVISFEELPGAVPDPYGQDIEVYEKTAKEIEKNIEVLLDKIEKLRGVI